MPTVKTAAPDQPAAKSGRSIAVEGHSTHRSRRNRWHAGNVCCSRHQRRLRPVGEPHIHHFFRNGGEHDVPRVRCAHRVGEGAA